MRSRRETRRLDDREQVSVQQLVERNQKLADLYCTGCSYCMPCPNDVNIPENFRYMNWYRVWGMEEQARKFYGDLTAAGHWTPWGFVKGLPAEACQECGECEANARRTCTSSTSSRKSPGHWGKPNNG